MFLVGSMTVASDQAFSDDNSNKEEHSKKSDKSKQSDKSKKSDNIRWRRVGADPAPKLISIPFPDWMQNTGPWSTLNINGCRVTPHNPVGHGDKSGGCFF
jgi:hypothetical protein